MTTSDIELLIRYQLLEYSSCIEVGTKGLEQLNKLAIASLVFNGALAAALGFAFERVVGVETMGPDSSLIVVATIGLVSLCAVAVLFNIGAAVANYNFFRNLKNVTRRHKELDDEIREVLRQRLPDQFGEDARKSLASVLDQENFSDEHTGRVESLGKWDYVPRTRYLNVGFYLIIAGSWLALITSILFALWAP